MSNNLVITMRIQQYVKNYMHEYGIKQKYLASKMGYSEKRFSQLMNGRTPFSIEDLTNFCLYFEVPATTFIPFETKGAS